MNDLQRLMIGERIGSPVAFTVARGSSLLEITVTPTELEVRSSRMRFARGPRSIEQRAGLDRASTTSRRRPRPSPRRISQGPPLPELPLAETRQAIDDAQSGAVMPDVDEAWVTVPATSATSGP